LTVLVTGGGGFLGRRIVQLLRARGDQVRVLSRRRHAEVAALGAASVEGDIRDGGAVRLAMRGVDVVFHVAAKVGTWGNRDDFDAVNVEGTRVVLDAARSAGVARFIHTSTPSVVGYASDVENGGPELTYARVHESPYAASKAEGERLVLAANGSGIATVALRPHLVIGPEDTLTLLRLMDRARKRRLRIVGDGRNKVDLTFVDNAAWAHLDAEAALANASSPCAGRAYFISNGEPVVLWPWINALLRDLDLPEAHKRVSLGVARAAGAIAETLWKVLPLGGEPPITRFMASALARSHWYDVGPATRDLGYVPRFSMDAARRSIVAWAKTTSHSRSMPLVAAR
jgi:2-alkyl-3-oxoalkanoate reductase